MRFNHTKNENKKNSSQRPDFCVSRLSELTQLAASHKSLQSGSRSIKISAASRTLDRPIQFGRACIGDVLIYCTAGTKRKFTMTWHTPTGDRCLVGEEAELVRDSLATMVEELASCRETEEEPWGYGVTLFDELTWQQQLAVLDLLATNLLHETDETLELSGINEAAVAAVYQNIVQQIELEIELHPVSPAEFRSRWRQAALDAYRENESDDVVRQEVLSQDADRASVFDIDAECLQVDRWRWLVELLADRVLWDRDFEMVNEMIDAPPERAAAMRAALGITPGYYTAIAPDPTDHQVDALFESLEQLTRAKPR